MLRPTRDWGQFMLPPLLGGSTSTWLSMKGSFSETGYTLYQQGWSQGFAGRLGQKKRHASCSNSSSLGIVIRNSLAQKIPRLSNACEVKARDWRDGLWLKSAILLPEDPSWVPSIHFRQIKVSVTSASGDPMPFSDLSDTRHARGAHTYTQANPIDIK